MSSSRNYFGGGGESHCIKKAIKRHSLDISSEVQSKIQNTLAEAKSLVLMISDFPNEYHKNKLKQDFVTKESLLQLEKNISTTFLKKVECVDYENELRSKLEQIETSLKNSETKVTKLNQTLNRDFILKGDYHRDKNNLDLRFRNLVTNVEELCEATMKLCEQSISDLKNPDSLYKNQLKEFIKVEKDNFKSEMIALRENILSKIKTESEILDQKKRDFILLRSNPEKDGYKGVTHKNNFADTTLQFATPVDLISEGTEQSETKQLTPQNLIDGYYKNTKGDIVKYEDYIKTLTDPKEISQEHMQKFRQSLTGQ